MRNILDNINNKDILDYLEYLKYERRVSINTIDSYGENLLFLNNYYSKDLKTLTKEEIRVFLDNSKLSTKTKAHYLSTFKSFYKYLIFMNKIDKNPCDGIKAPKIEKRLPNYLTKEEIDKLFDIRMTKPIDYRNKAMLEVLFATGIRISELVSLELDQVNFEECIIRIYGKGSKERIVPIHENALNYLKIYIYNYRPFLLNNDNNNYVFLNRNGEKISRQGFFKILKSLSAASGIKKEISPHVLRHSFATYLLNNGADLRVIQELLGHENLETTEIYSHLQNKKIEEDYANHPHAHY